MHLLQNTKKVLLSIQYLLNVDSSTKLFWLLLPLPYRRNHHGTSYLLQIKKHPVTRGTGGQFILLHGDVWHIQTWKLLAFGRYLSPSRSTISLWQKDPHSEIDTFVNRNP